MTNSVEPTREVLTRLSAAEIAALTLELGRGGLTLTAKDGAISSEIGALELCGGLATGRVSLNLSEARTEAELAGSLSEPARIVTLFPDSGFRYLSTIYNDDWMREHGFL